MEVKTRENFQMGYSSAYPKWRELGEKWGSEGVESEGVGEFGVREL